MDNARPTAASEALAALGERYFTTQHTFDPYSATLLGTPGIRPPDQ